MLGWLLHRWAAPDNDEQVPGARWIAFEALAPEALPHMCWDHRCLQHFSGERLRAWVLCCHQFDGDQKVRTSCGPGPIALFTQYDFDLDARVTVPHT